MDLSNKLIVINTITTTSYPPNTDVEVRVSEELAPGVHRVVGVYSLNFPEVYSGLEHPALMSAVAEVLEGIPEP